MAIDDQIDDDDDVKKPKKKSNLLLIILIIISTLLLIVVSIGTTLYLSGALTHEKASVAAEGDKGKVEKSARKKSKKHAKKKEERQSFYVELGDPLVVNFIENNQIRYLQVKMEVMTYDEGMSEKIKTHMPLIRNNLLMMLSGLDYETISSLAGKQKIRAEALAEIQNILKEKTGDPGVEAVYFTSFVMQ